jgi:hypothetical protein
MFTLEGRYTVRKLRNQELMREAEKERFLRSVGLGPRPIHDLVLDLSCNLPVIKATPACASQPVL